MERSKNDLILAIETTIDGGSLSLLKGQIEIESWAGEREISRAEDILEQIAGLLERNSVERREITAICVSKGAGSLTGEKIGLATAKGMSRAIGCQLIEVPILNALLINAGQEFQGEILTAIFSGKNRVFWRSTVKKDSFFYNLTPEPATSTKEEFALALESKNFKMAIFHLPTEENLITAGNREVVITRDNLAKLIGRVG